MALQFLLPFWKGILLLDTLWPSTSLHTPSPSPSLLVLTCTLLWTSGSCWKNKGEKQLFYRFVTCLRLLPLFTGAKLKLSQNYCRTHWVGVVSWWPVPLQLPGLWSQRKYSGHAVLICLSMCYTPFWRNWCVRVGLRCLQREKERSKSSTTQPGGLSTKGGFLVTCSSLFFYFICFLAVDRGLIVHCGLILILR